MRTPFHELHPARGTCPTVFGPFEQMGRTPFRLLTAATGAVIILIGILLVALPDATVLTRTAATGNRPSGPHDHLHVPHPRCALHGRRTHKRTVITAKKRLLSVPCDIEIPTQNR